MKKDPDSPHRTESISVRQTEFERALLVRAAGCLFHGDTSAALIYACTSAIHLRQGGGRNPPLVIASKHALKDPQTLSEYIKKLTAVQDAIATRVARLQTRRASYYAAPMVLSSLSAAAPCFAKEPTSRGIVLPARPRRLGAVTALPPPAKRDLRTQILRVRVAPALLLGFEMASELNYKGELRDFLRGSQTTFLEDVQLDQASATKTVPTTLPHIQTISSVRDYTHAALGLLVAWHELKSVLRKEPATAATREAFGRSALAVAAVLQDRVNKAPRVPGVRLRNPLG